MTFAEADAQYELIKQRYQAGVLTDEQYDDQLRGLMVLDDSGRWWAKSRENGVWHYYEAVSGNWMLGAPPVTMPSTPPASQPAVQPPTQEVVNPAVNPVAPAAPAAGNPPRRASQGGLPKWAAVAPSSAQPAAQEPAKTGDADVSAAGGSAKPADKGAAGGYSTLDISPMPELSGSLKIVFYVLSLLVPFLGFVLFLVYRKKPAATDRSAARVFMILGVISLVFLCLFTVGIFVLEAVLLGAGS
jgi:hypothetical protein